MARAVRNTRIPYATFALAAVLVVIYMLQVSVSGFTDVFFLNVKALSGEPWRLVSAMLLHGSLQHLLSNLFALVLFGTILESLVGHRNFVVIFVTAGTFGNIIGLLFYPQSLGASGAIYGVIGAVTALRPFMMIWAFGLIVPMFVAALIYVFVDVFGLFIPDNIGHVAHLSGIVVGFLLALLLRVRHPHFFRRPTVRPHVRLHEGSVRAWEERYLR